MDFSHSEPELIKQSGQRAAAELPQVNDLVSAAKKPGVLTEVIAVRNTHSKAAAKLERPIRADHEIAQPEDMFQDVRRNQDVELIVKGQILRVRDD